MAKSSPDAIILTNSGLLPQFEGKAGEAGILPGHIVEESAVGTVVKSNVNGGKTVPFIAIENRIAGKTIADAYANGETVYYRALIPGTRCLGRVADGADAISFNSFLNLDGDGQVEVVDNAEEAMFRARQAVDNSGGSDVVTIEMVAL